MSLHESINAEMQRYIEARDDCVSIMPSALAAHAYDLFSTETVEAHIKYGCIEHFKSMARRILARNYDADSDDSAAYAQQGELFSGHLQHRYPIPHKTGQEAQYKLREALTVDERAWNVRTLRKSGEARLNHADALEAEAMSATAA